MARPRAEDSLNDYKIGLKLPPPMYAALVARGRQLGYDDPKDFLMAGMHAAFLSDSGWLLNLERPKPAKLEMVDGELPFSDAPARIPCALCDRGDGQLGHADGCPNA